MASVCAVVAAAKDQAFVDVVKAEAEAEVGEWEDTIQLKRWSRWIRCFSRVRTMLLKRPQRVFRLKTQSSSE